MTSNDGEITEPIYSTTTPTTTTTPDSEPATASEPAKPDSEPTPRQRRKRERSRQRYKRQRDRLAAENAAMRVTLAAITTAILANGQQLKNIEKGKSE